MKVYVFGNEDIRDDSAVFKIMKNPQLTTYNLQFTIVKPNEDLPFANERNVVILDTIVGINKVTLFDETDLDKIVLSPRTSVHDFDLGFQLKYLKKIGKLESIKIIGLPQNKEINYNLLNSIFKKLVAQDIQGS